LCFCAKVKKEVRHREPHWLVKKTCEDMGAGKSALRGIFSSLSFCYAKTSAKAMETAASRGEPSPLCGSVEYTMPPKARGNEQ
jgi:hypothetical protein